MKKLFYLLGVYCMLLLASSCTNNFPTSKENQFQQNQAIKNIQFFESTLNPISSLSIVKNSFIDSDLLKNIYCGDMILETAEFNSLLKKVLGNVNIIEKDSKVVSFVLYMSKFDNDINSSNIEAISLLLNKNGILSHKFYVKTDQYEEILDFSGNITSYSTFDFDILLNYALKKTKHTDSPAYVSFNLADASRVDQSRENSLSTILINSFVDIDIEPSAGCGSKCHNEDGGCTTDSEGEKLCDNCASSEVEETAAKNSISIDLNAKLPKSIAYDFRDNFLKKSEFGRKYINYYYKLSYFMKAKKLITGESFWKHISLGSKLYSIAKKLQYGSEKEILLSTEDSKEILIMVSFYKQKTSNKSILNMLNDIEKDIAYFAGKSNFEARKAFK